MPASRRDLLRLAGWAGALAALAGPASAHTPYRQWKVYRRKHLLLLAHRDDPKTYALARALAALLLERLPESKARVTRAPDLQRVVSLLGTDQLQYAVLARRDAAAMARGAAPLDAFGQVPLAVLAVLGGHLLVARPDVPDRHAWLIAEALDGGARALPDLALPRPDTPPLPGLPVHDGVGAYLAGAPKPDKPAAAGRPDPEDHDHHHGYRHE